MEESLYHYFYQVVLNNSSNKIFLIINFVIELDLHLPYIFRIPIKIKDYVNGTKSTNLDEYILYLENISLYNQFQKLKDKTSMLYPIYFCVIYFILILLFFVFYLILSIHKDKKTTSVVKKGCLVSLIIKGIINLYDHIIFRSISLIFLDVIINQLCYSNSVYTLILILIFLLFTIFIHLFYYKTFRLCQKFNSSCKYIYDNKFMLYYDFCSLVLKTMIAVDNNIINNQLTFFFSIMNIGFILILNYYFLRYKCINIVSCLKGFSAILFILIIFTNILFGNSLNSLIMFCIYLFFCVITSLSIALDFRAIMHNLLPPHPKLETITSGEQLNFDLLSEYFDTKDFMYYFRKVVFTQREFLTKDNVGELSKNYLIQVEKSYKIAPNPQLKNEYEFYIVYK